MPTRFRSVLLLLAGIYVALAVVPLGWTFGAAFLRRHAELAELALSAAAWAALGRSAALGLISALGALLIAAPLAFLTGRADLPGRRFLSALALTPLALPPYVVALALRPWLPSSLPLASASLVMAFSLYPLPFVFLRAGLASVDPSLEEAGFLARGTLATIRYVTWPLVAPWCIAALGVVFLLGLGEFGTPALLGIPVYPGLITLRFAATYDAAGAALAALPLLAVVLVLLAIEATTFRGAKVFAARLRAPRLVGLGRFRPWATLFCVGLLFASPGFPLMAALAQVDTAGVKSAMRMVAEPAVNSVLVSLGGCAFAVVAAIAFALLARARTKSYSGLPLAFFVLPGAILGIGLIGFWNQPALPPLYGSILLVVLALGIRYMVLTERAVETGLRDVPPSQEEVARLAGRSDTSITFRILLPQIRVSILAGAVAFLLFALRDLDTVITIYPPGSETLAVRLYTVLANSPQSLQAAISLAQVALTLPVVSILVLVTRRSRWLL